MAPHPTSAARRTRYPAVIVTVRSRGRDGRFVHWKPHGSPLGGAHVPDLSVATTPSTKYRAEWVAVPDRDAKLLSTRSRKLEGMWWGGGGAYFVCSFARFTDGSAAQHDGQVWFLDPLGETLELKLHFAYTPLDQDGDPDGPDNITVSAYGG
jgi:hypothetical protein